MLEKRFEAQRNAEYEHWLKLDKAASKRYHESGKNKKKTTNKKLRKCFFGEI